MLFLVSVSGWGQEAEEYRTITGKVIDVDERTPLAFVTIQLTGTNRATISNTAGEFALRIPDTTGNANIAFSYLGYETKEVLLGQLTEQKRNLIALKRASIVLPEVLVRQSEAGTLIKEVIRRIPMNYGKEPVQMVGFYRELIRKNSNYLSVAEAVLDIYKASYATMQNDGAKIYKGRRSVDMARMDTVFFKYQGGVGVALLLDLAKNYETILPEDFQNYYDFYCENITTIDGHPCYVVTFDQKKGIKDPLFRGKFYIDSDTYAIVKVEFNMNVEGRDDAIDIFLKRKPAGMKVDVVDAQYLMQFRRQGKLWYYQNSRAEVRFKCRWPRRLFNSNYLLMSEMAVTDWGKEDAVKFPRKDRLSPDAVIIEKVADFEDENFWEDYSIIEPEQSLEAAVKRLARKLKRRENSQNLE